MIFRIFALRVCFRTTAITVDSFITEVFLYYLFLYTYLSIYLSIYLPIYQYIYPSIHPSIHPSTHPPTDRSIYLSIYISLSIYLWGHSSSSGRALDWQLRGSGYDSRWGNRKSGLARLALYERDKLLSVTLATGRPGVCIL